MFPGPMSAGPPPPEARNTPNGAMAPPMPPSIIGAQGAQADQQKKDQSSSLQKQTLDLAVQSLLEYKNSLEKLMTAMKAVAPESVSLFIPAIEVGKALEAQLQKTTQRASADQPSMAGMPGGQGPMISQMGGAGGGPDAGAMPQAA